MHPFDFVERCCLLGWANDFNTSSTSSREALYSFPGCNCDCYFGYVHDTSLRDQSLRTRIPNNVERDGQTASTSFNIRENKGNVEWLLKQSLNAFNIDSTRLKGGGGYSFNIAVQQNRTGAECVFPGFNTFQSLTSCYILVTPSSKGSVCCLVVSTCVTAHALREIGC